MPDHFCKAFEEALGSLWRRSPDGERVVPIYDPNSNELSILQPDVHLQTRGLISAPDCAACEQYQSILPAELDKYPALQFQHIRMDFLLDFPKSLPAIESRIEDDRGAYSFYTAVYMADDQNASGGQLKITPLGQQGFLSPRLVNPRELDFDIVREWLSACSTQHECICFVKPRPELQSVSLIDTHANKVLLYSSIPRPENQDVEYLCLSYVWGSKEQNIDREGDRLLRVPRTIEDAMTFTRGVGKRYLWVDSVGDRPQ
jgi:hypothetical protein